MNRKMLLVTALSWLATLCACRSVSVTSDNTLAFPEWFETRADQTIPGVVEFGHRLRIENETGARIRVEVRAFDLSGKQIASSFRFDAPELGHISGDGLAESAESFLLTFQQVREGRAAGQPHQRLVRPGFLGARIWLRLDSNGELVVKSAYRIPPEEGQLKPALPLGWRYDANAGEPYVFELRVGDLFVVRNEMGHTQPFHFDLVLEDPNNPGSTKTQTLSGVFPKSGVATMPWTLDGITDLRHSLRFWLPGYSPRSGEIDGDQSIHVGSIDLPLGDEPFVITLARSQRGVVAASVGSGRFQPAPSRRRVD
jgi:hypothetical protein